jgi:retron-type reverse transcriptase
LPSITTLGEFSAATHLSKGLIFRFSKYGDKYYYTYNLPKKDGSMRQIAQPCNELKSLQAWIKVNILQSLVVSNACKGFEKNTSIADNALPHIGANAILVIDLENFFPTINIKQVWSMFRTIGYSARIAGILAAICTFKETLPQGSPASPKISNLVTLQLDKRLLGYVGKRAVVYTRYADDLTFSTYSPSILTKIYPKVKEIIEDEGFFLNQTKTRFAGPGRQHCVTGLVVTDKDLGIGRKKLHWLRALIYNLHKYDKEKVSKDELMTVIGWLAYINGIDEKRRKILDVYIGKLKSKYANTALDLLPSYNAREVRS